MGPQTSRDAEIQAEIDALCGQPPRASLDDQFELQFLDEYRRAYDEGVSRRTMLRGKGRSEEHIWRLAEVRVLAYLDHSVEILGGGKPVDFKQSQERVRIKH